MLIVIGIMLIMVAAAATLMQPASESRRIREAARLVNIYLCSARNRAMELQRPCGVTFHCFSTNTPGFALSADQCEVPPCYSGDTDTSSVVQVQQTALNAVTYYAKFTESGFSPSTDIVNAGDLIQFNGQGYFYKITSVGGTLGLTLNTPSGMDYVFTPWPVSPNWSAPVPYRIFRAPLTVKGGATPLQLPARTVIDLEGSGSTGAAGQQNLTIIFSPTGAVDSVYHGATKQTISGLVYLLVGRRELMDGESGHSFTQDNSNETTLTNFQDLNNLWVTVNIQTGAINTEPMASSTGCSSWSDALDAARSLAKQGQGMGGR